MTAAEHSQGVVVNIASGQIYRLGSSLGSGISYDAIFASDDAHIFAGMDNGKIMTWPVSASVPAEVFAQLNAKVFSLDFLLDKKLLAAGVEDGRVFVWDAASHQTP